MKEYEISLTYSNACGGAAHARVTFEEATLANTDDYVRHKHGCNFDRFTKETLPDGRVVYRYDNGSVAYVYEFTEV